MDLEVRGFHNENFLWSCVEMKVRFLLAKQFLQGEGEKKHVGRILEFFKTTEGEDYFRVQWFFRAEDTVGLSLAENEIFAIVLQAKY